MVGGQIFNSRRAHCWTGAWLFLLALAALGEEFLRLCGLGCLDLAKEDGELFLGDLVVKMCISICV